MRADARLTVAVLATFVAGGLAPQAALVAHDHAGGGAPHVHAVPHRHGEEPPHVHPVAAPADPTGAAVAAARHVHWQAPFQHADHTVAPPLARVDRVVPAPPAPPAAASDGPSPAARSRGPPPPRSR